MIASMDLRIMHVKLASIILDMSALLQFLCKAVTDKCNFFGRFKFSSYILWICLSIFGIYTQMPG